jgi:hypothetical protein
MKNEKLSTRIDLLLIAIGKIKEMKGNVPINAEGEVKAIFKVSELVNMVQAGYDHAQEQDKAQHKEEPSSLMASIHDAIAPGKKNM